MPDAPTICLYTDLQEPEVGLLGNRFDSQAAGVRVSANHGDGIACLPFVTDGECDDGGAVSSKVVLATWLEGGRPGIAFLDFFEASFCKSLNCRVNSMICYKQIRRWF